MANARMKPNQARHSRFGLIFFVLAALCIFGFSVDAKSETRHALVIGNSDYGSGFSLSNPINDSTAIANKLASIDYKVHKDQALYDLTIDEFNDEIDSFLSSIEDGSSILFYYAGHGSASAGENFLIPILPEGVRLRTESDIRNRSIALTSILERIQRYNPSGVNVLFIDACRDAPVENYSRSINLTGLTSLDTRWQPQGSFIGFSTEYGKIAVDGEGSSYSPFASAVLNNLDTRADEPIELFYKGVSNEVYQTTSGQQFPIQEPKIRGNYCLTACKSGVAGENIENEFAYTTAVTDPVNAEVCYRLDGDLESWNCGKQLALPVGRLLDIRVTATGYSTYTSTTILQNPSQKLTVALKPKARRGYKIAGAIAAIVVTGILVNSKKGDSNSDDDYRITLTLPTQ